MAVNERLKNAIDSIKFSFKLKQADVAEKLRVKSTYLSDMINGRVPFSDSMKEKIYEVFSYNMNEENEPIFKEAPLYYGGEEFEMPTYVPLLPISAQGGSLNDFIVSVKDSDCERIISPIKGADFAMTVAGDSMSPEYPSGSQILIKKINERAFIDWGKVYVLDTCNGSVVKRIFPADDKDPNKVKCVSINPDYPPFEVSLEDVYGVYRVLLSMSVK
jgi:phage repressor protein C with HTH and peptisase S24 domain